MDESYVRKLFNNDSSISSVKLIRDKNTFQLAGYGFVEFKTHPDCQRIMKNYNGKYMGNTKKIFKLNWATLDKKDPNVVSLFISDLDYNVTEQQILVSLNILNDRMFFNQNIHLLNL